MKIYLPYLKKYKLPFALAILCVALESVCDLLGPTLMSKIIDQGISRSSVNGVLYWGGWMLAATGLGVVFAVARNYLASTVSQRIGADLRRDLFARILRFSETGADQIESGSLITRMTNDTNMLVQFINGTMRIIFKAPLTCLGSIILASLLNLRLSLLIYGTVLLIGSCILVSTRLSYPRFARLQKAMDRMNTVVQEYLLGIRLVKAFGTYSAEVERFEDANSSLKKQGISSQAIITFMSPLLTLASGLGTGLMIWVGSLLFPRGLASAGDISAFTIYMAQILSSLLMITNILNTFIRTKASTQRLQEVLSCPLDDDREDQRDVPLQRKTSVPAGAIRFEHVTFSYPQGSGKPALTDISFQVEAGTQLAVIGPTGSGKSTLAWLLLRFYDPDSGNIFLDGQSLSDLPCSSARSQVSIVPQKPMLFSGSVADNLRWGKADASQEEMEACVRQAQAEFIHQMPGQYDSPLGSGGVNLSGGQKQRLSIARALLRRSPVLILDDSTSALDAVTEGRVRRALSQRREGTTITITQKCTTAMYADRILVLEDGRLVGFGTHQELLQNCETYRSIYNSQVDSSYFSGKEAF